MLCFMTLFGVLPFLRLQVKEEIKKLKRLGTCGSPQPCVPLYCARSKRVPNQPSLLSTSLFFPAKQKQLRELFIRFMPPQQQKNKSLNRCCKHLLTPTTIKMEHEVFGKKMTYVCFLKAPFSRITLVYLIIYLQGLVYGPCAMICRTQPGWMVASPFQLEEEFPWPQRIWPWN